MSLCLCANAPSLVETRAAPRRESLFERLLGRMAAFSAVEAEGELMPAPSRADIARAMPTLAQAPRRRAVGGEVNGLLL